MTEVIRTDERSKDKHMERIPFGVPAKAEDIAPVFAFFAYATLAYVTGQVLAADGGIAIY